MKLYLFYLKIGEKDYNGWRYSLIPYKLQYQYMEEGKYYIGFYAWTNKASYVKRFFKIRKKKCFYLKEVEMEKDEYKKFRIDYKMERLTIQEIEEDGEKLLLTKEEYDNITDCSSEIFFDFFISTAYDYTVLKPDFQDAIDFIGYACSYDRYIGGEIGFETDTEIQDRREFADYSVGFSVTLNGYRLFLLDEHPLFLFVIFYRFFLKSEFILEKMEGVL